jgi:hypothetical protein
MVKGPMTPEAKAKLMERLKAGRAHHSAMRAKDPSHKPRKARKGKHPTTDTAEALSNPLTAHPVHSKIDGIDAPKSSDKNIVADTPVDPAKNESSHIDVPNLPEDSKLKKIVKSTVPLPIEHEGKGLSATGKPARYNANDMILNEETGMQSI